MTETTPTTEEWIYAGERHARVKNTTLNVWIDPSGEELYFSKVSGGIPGQIYAVQVTRDSSVHITGSPRYLAEQATREPATAAQIDAWRAETAAARQMIESDRAEKAARADDELQAALEVLRRHHSKLRSYVLGRRGRS